MPTKVTMPQLGESVDEATITRWLKSVGEPVEEFEPLLEVNTDKVDSEIPSPEAGVVLDILIPEGATVNAGDLLAWIGPAGAEAPASAEDTPQDEQPAAAPEITSQPAAAQAAPTPTAATPPTPGRDRQLGFISPVVARMAAEHNLDLYAIEGRGRGGRITKNDVLAYMEGQTAQPAAPQTPAAAAAPVPTPTHAPQPKPAAPSPRAPQPQAEPGSLIPHSTVRRAIAEHMVQSKRTSPHVTTVMEVDLSRVVAHRQAHKTAFGREGVKLTFTPYFIAAVAAALKAHPLVNASWREDGVYIHSRINIGMATSLGDDGLIVPVIKDAGQYSLAGLASIVNDLAERARARKLKPDEVKDGTFTITNHGVSGSLFAMPIINQPQCAILGVGVIQKRVMVVSGPDGGDSIAIRPMAYLSLTFDHRILDGAAADYFLAKIVSRLQEWPKDD